MDICTNVLISVQQGENTESFTLQYAALATEHTLFTAIRTLILLGGVGSIQALQKDQTKHPSLLRALQRSKKIRSLGAGYFALASLHLLSIEEWMQKFLAQSTHKISLSRCVEIILKQYPHGDPKEVEKWLQKKFKGIFEGNLG